MTNVLLLSCYELGHQPLALAWPTAVLQQAGFPVTAVDLSISDFPTQAAAQADVVAISVPMHTALRLGVEAGKKARAANPDAVLVFYGLYAWLNRIYLLQNLADAIIAGEAEVPLLSLVQAIAKGEDWKTVPGITSAEKLAVPYLHRLELPVPARSPLPSLDQYARYDDGRSMSLAGYVETTRGCLHTCHHCPVVPIYHGRFFAIPLDVVMGDIRQQVMAGARHITFGDPDFLNGPGHALKITRALHTEFPHITFDFTTKVEHIIQHQDKLAEFAQNGCTFIVSAFESTNNNVLTRLNKGHTLADMETALQLLAKAGIAVQPTWVAFTPWTTLDDYLHMLAWIRQHNLVYHVPVVQLAVRLLIPPESELLQHDDAAAWLGALDAENFTYRWQHADPRMDQLHELVTRIAEEESHSPLAAFAKVEEAAYLLAGLPLPQWETAVSPTLPPPRLTEDWFC